MGYIIDSHVLIWQLQDPSRISPKAAQLIESDHALLFVSPASAYEIQYKVSRGKFPALPESFAAIARTAGYAELPVTIAAAEFAARFPTTHRDPWDRLIAGQALAYGFSIVTIDPEIKKLGIQTIW
ncbi:MAG: type II toxin-antitoxin system VapC family toxin [Parvularculaceae bacterium]|nr:type II toxin-antitoxin system VapC family toxin [Parvularculaceae bacterium]